MAKFGEGDKRWIVEDRPDGVNVHGWHWAEKDCLEWSRKRLGQLLEGLQIVEGEGSCWGKISKLESCEGEAYLNTRKGKMIPGYELNIKIAWEGEIRDGGEQVVAKARGHFELPYVADENADDDPEVRVSVAGNGPGENRLRDCMVAKGRPLVTQKVKQFVKEFAEGGPVKNEKPGGGAEGGVAKNGGVKAAAAEAVKPAAKPVEKKSAAGRRTIAMTQKFMCRPMDVYEALTDDRRVRAFTQSNAAIKPEVGGSFMMFDGAVTGVNQELKPGELIIQKWRFNNWEDGVYSTVCMTLEEPEHGLTVLKLTQTDVPEEDRYGNHTVVENTERGWRDLIFHKIRAVFGYGC